MVTRRSTPKLGMYIQKETIGRTRLLLNAITMQIST